MATTARKSAPLGGYINRLCKTQFSYLVPYFRKLIWSHRQIYWLYMRWRGGMVNAEQDKFSFWIDGYPRSANTFISNSLQLSFPDKVIRSHSHSPFLPIAGIRKGLPGIFVIREPIEAISSYIVMTGHADVTAISFYIDFHRTIVKLVDQIYVADFRRVTTSIDEVISNFCEFFKLTNPENLGNLEERAFDLISKSYVTTSKLGKINPKVVAKPDARRAMEIDLIKTRLSENPKLAKKLQLCREL